MQKELKSRIAWVAILAAFLLVFSSFCAAAHEPTVKVNVKQQYGLSQNGIAAAVLFAKRCFLSQPNQIVILSFPEGTYSLPNTQGKGSQGAIILKGIHPGDHGALVFEGVGDDENHNTTLVFPDMSQDMIFSYASDHVHFEKMIFSRGQMTVTQGTVKQVNRSDHTMTLSIDSGYPTPEALYNPLSTQGRFLKRYNATNPMKPTMIVNHNQQIAWSSVAYLSGRDWLFHLSGRQMNDLPYYLPGTKVGVKSKPPSQAYHFSNATDITFDHVTWLGTSNGAFRHVNNIAFSNCTIDRMPAIQGRAPYMATPAGGPQIGNPADPNVTNVTVDHFTSMATGDDSLALFNVDNANIKNVSVSDSFSRGLLLFNSDATVLSANTLTRCPLAQCDGPREKSSGLPPGTLCRYSMK